MTRVLSFRSARGGPAREDAPKPRALSPGPCGAQNSRLDPYAARRAFPAQWADFLAVAFRGPQAVQRIALTFHVSEKAARNWLAGEHGCNGQHIVQAARGYPELAQAILFAAE